MTQTFATRITAVILAAAVVAAAWVPTVTTPRAQQNTALVTAIA